MDHLPDPEDCPDDDHDWGTVYDEEGYAVRGCERCGIYEEPRD